MIQYNPAFLSSLSSMQRMVTNTQLCKDLTAHLQSLNDELLQPLVGKSEDDIPKATRAAVEKYVEYLGVVSVGDRCLVDNYRCIIDGLKQLSQPKMDNDGICSRWIHSKDMEDEIRNLMKDIELSTRSYMVSFPKEGERLGYSPVRFGIDRSYTATGTRSAPTRRDDPACQAPSNRRGSRQ